MREILYGFDRNTVDQYFFSIETLISETLHENDQQMMVSFIDIVRAKINT